MKWMVSTTIAALAVSSAVAAQSGKTMDRPAMDSSMKTTYTGCVVAINHGGSFLLTHVATPAGKMDDHMPMKHDHEMMNNDSSMTKDAMGSDALTLVGSSDLKKHVGHTVAITGSLSKDTMEPMQPHPPTFTVASLKVLAKSCS